VKKTWVFLFLTAVIVCYLSACSAAAGSNEKKEEEEAQPVEAASVETTEDINGTTSYRSNPQVTDDRMLTEVGQKNRDARGEATLKQIKHINKTYSIGPVRLTVKEAKIIHLIPDYSMIDYFHVLTHKKEFDFVKIWVEIENTSEQPVHFAPVALFETSTGEKFDWQKDIYLEELNGKLEASEVKRGNLGFILNAGPHHEKSSEESQIEELPEWVKLITSDVFDKEKRLIEKSKEVKLEL
jgi:hypothetical protein